MAAVACTLSILIGCTAKLNPAEEGTISFSAGSPLLRDDATKSGTDLKTAFAVNDYFYVYGTKTVSATRQVVFNGQSVSLKGTGWEYSPLRFWDSNATQYDFLAISGPSSAPDSNPANGSRISASVTYDATTGTPYDLMAAGYQRTNGSVDPVHFEFSHLLSAVRVTIINDAPSISITVNSYGFRNICYRATGTVEQSGNGLASMGTSDWGTPSYTSSTILGYATNPGTELANGEEFALTADKWDLMVPQDLDPYGDYIPQLMLDYEYDQVNPYTSVLEHNHPVFPIRLEEIAVKNSNELITRWLPGKRYNYEIHIRLGGGIIVNVTVTDWDEVPAETPGLTIDDA